ncbi:hypothetical protein [Janthinobacterium agaricidamnosum]|uniref:Putative prolin-rich transmembrane protein n=1 Tax=Janthinobacterium agaricidamnosum NBRC 102515 = DSM 9628 TaxID=1349767 RepID=W0VB43_9BURK|nr:hypothetical protein [Janthinobacterium agaricidamnosum]CDG84578.1 putative prolin-rich transmembrane protein [Janthinobacterium agaricidamnosum NBRC 102515 = DSM 9628]
MKRQHVIMGVALAGAAALVLFGDRQSGSDVSEAVERKPAAARDDVAAATGKPARPGDKEVAILALRPRAELVGEAGDAVFDGGDAVFLSQNWNPPPPKAGTLPSGPPPPPPAPTAPAMPFTYIGKAVGGGVWEVFLSRGADKTYVVREQTIIDGTYRVEKIAPPSMSMTYLPLNQVQQINIGALD